jgi:hypothetical protein
MPLSRQRLGLMVPLWGKSEVVPTRMALSLRFRVGQIVWLDVSRVKL